MPDISELCALMQARLQHQQAALRRISAEEAALRDQLQALNRAERAGGSVVDFGLRTLGADLLWQAWVAHQREGLQTRLANLMVRRAEVLDQTRSAFGRHEAARRLWYMAREARDTRRAKAETARILDTVIAQWPGR
jgi:hypothetical protein